MTYNPNIPQSTDLISVSQGQLLTNFTQLNSQFGVDHNPYDDSGSNGNGHHVQVTFDASSSPAAPTGTISVVYPSSVSGVQQLFYRNATTTTQITGPTTIGTSGTTFLPGGLILKWGSLGTIGSSVAFSTAFPTACLSMTVTGSSTLYTGGFVVSSLSASSFTVSRTSGSGSTGYYYIAIGH